MASDLREVVSRQLVGPHQRGEHLVSRQRLQLVQRGFQFLDVSVLLQDRLVAVSHHFFLRLERVLVCPDGHQDLPRDEGIEEDQAKRPVLKDVGDKVR